MVRRGLKDPKEPTKRKACVIIDNMVKLVPDPREALPFLDAKFKVANTKEISRWANWTVALAKCESRLGAITRPSLMSVPCAQFL